MIYQSGYLTVKDYDPIYDRFLLDFPNNEVKSGFVTLVAADYLKTKGSMSSWIIDVVESLKKGNTEQLRTLFASFLADIPYTMRDKREKERYFHYTFYLIFRLISVYTVYTEKEQREGAEPRAVGLHRRDGQLHLHLRVQARRFGRRGVGTDRSERLCPSVRSGQAQAI